jgi:hypothetical protein
MQDEAEQKACNTEGTEEEHGVRKGGKTKRLA